MLAAPLERFALCRRGHPANAPSGFFFAPGGSPESWRVAPAALATARYPTPAICRVVQGARGREPTNPASLSDGTPQSEYAS